jgi:uncharacterized protein (TIGR01244 family)
MTTRTRISTSVLCLWLALSIAPARAQVTDQAAPSGVRNYTRVDASVACGGAPSLESFAEFKRLGFAAVINFREAGEQGTDVEAEAEAARAAGLKYIHLPFNSSAPDPAVVDAFLKALDDRTNLPVFIHCGSANRVGAMWLIKRVIVDGWDIDKASAEASAIGLTSEGLRQFALEYVAAHRK